MFDENVDGAPFFRNSVERCRDLLIFPVVTANSRYIRASRRSLVNQSAIREHRLFDIVKTDLPGLGTAAEDALRLWDLPS